MLCFDVQGQPLSETRWRLGYVVCNPLTKDWLNVPLNLHNWFTDSIIAFYLHSQTGEYRLLQQYYKRGTGGYGYEVFSIEGGGAWRPINASPGISRRSYLMGSTNIVQGSIHFMHFPDDCDCIVAFDTNTEQFRKMSLPPRLRPRYYYSLIEMAGSLGLWQVDSDSLEIDIWSLKDYTKEEWIKQYTVSIQNIVSKSVDPYSTRCKLFAIWEDGKELLIQYNHGCFVLYNLESKTSKKKEINKFRRAYPRSCLPYIETLVSCNSLKKKK